MLPLASLSSVAEVAADLAQVAAVVVGGFWAYWKFFRGRTFRYRAELSVSAKFLSLGDVAVLRISARMRNTGLSRIPLLPGEKVVLVDCLSPEQLALSDQAVYWGPQQGLRRAAVFEEHEALEPGELIFDTVLVPVPVPTPTEGEGEGEGLIIYRIRMLVTTKRLSLRRGGQRRLWSANSLVEGSRQGAGQQKGTHGAAQQ